MPNLVDTIELMTSANYKERFVAEYWQTKIRYEKLKDFCNKIEASKYSDEIEEPKHDCSLDLLKMQKMFMGQYLNTLEVRALIERIDLNDELMQEYFKKQNEANRVKSESELYQKTKKYLQEN